MAADTNNTKIFSSLQYYVAGKITAETKEILDKAGAKCNAYMGELVKVAISDTTDDENEYAEIADIYDIPVVSCEWVMMSYKCGKQLPTKAFPPKLSATSLFKGKVFTTSRIAEKKDLNALWAMVTYHGGVTQRMLNEKVTHLISTGITGKKYNSALKLSSVMVVTPDWVHRCIEQKRIIDEAEYHPKLLVTSSSPALRRQLLSPLPTIVDAKKKPMAGRSPPKHKAKTPPATFPQPPPTLTSHSAASATFLNTSPRGKTPRPKMHEMPSGFPGFQQESAMPGGMAGHMGQTMMRPQYRPHMQAQFGESGYGTPPGYGLMPGSQMSTPPGHLSAPPLPHQQAAQMGSRSFVKTTSPVPSPMDMGFGPIHYTGAARQSPVTSNMSGVRPQLPSGQRGSPGNRKTPPLMNLGPMNEVPLPSQASLPEETPIIRMTNMAAFPMGGEVPTSQRRSPASSGKTTPSKSPSATTPHRQPGAKAAALNQAANVSVIKPVQLPAAAMERGVVTTATPAAKASQAVVTTAESGGHVDTQAVYYGYDSNETVPADMCLVGCIFYMGEYLKSDPCEDWIKAIEENGGTVDPSYSNRVTHVLVETQASDVCRLALNDHKRVVTAHWLNDVIAQNKMEPPWRAHHLPHPHVAEKLGCANQVIGVTGFDKAERRILYVMVKMLGASFTTYLAKTNTALVCKRLEGLKVTKAKEWGVECVNVQWLSELVLGHMRALKLPIDPKYRMFGKADDFLIDRSMAAAVMSGWRVPLKIPKDNCRKFKPSTKASDSMLENKRKADGEIFLNPSKRLRLQEIPNTKSNLPVGQVPQVLLTGFTALEKHKYSEMVKILGGVVCDDVTRCTHLIAEKVMRTPKFLLAINYCSYLSSSDWISESAKAGHFVDERVFTLQNSEAGSMWNILEALERRNVHGKPFKGLLFHLTPGVPLSTSLPRKFLTELITAAGGSVQPADEKCWRASKILESQKANHTSKPTYIVIACRDDIHICMDLLYHNIEIYSVEFILSGVMNQSAPYESVLCTKDE